MASPQIKTACKRGFLLGNKIKDHNQHYEYLFYMMNK